MPGRTPLVRTSVVQEADAVKSMMMIVVGMVMAISLIVNDAWARGPAKAGAPQPLRSQTQVPQWDQFRAQAQQRARIQAQERRQFQSQQGIRDRLRDGSCLAVPTQTQDRTQRRLRDGSCVAR
jgi:hypothetical protein